MKIIEEGTPPSRRLPWWAEQEWKCHSCGCRFQLELGDELRTDVRVSGAEVTINCPTCSAWIKHTNAVMGHLVVNGVNRRFEPAQSVVSTPLKYERHAGG